MTHRYLPSLLLFVVCSCWTFVVAAAGYNEEGFGLPTLLIISHPGASQGQNEDEDEADEEEGRRVRAMVSIVKLEKPLPARSNWRILPGTVYPLYKRPRGEVKVKLYTGEGANKQLLCSINVRYFRNRSNRWQPHYRLDPDSIIIWRGSAWTPLNPVVDETNLLFLANTRSPNGQGYYPYLDLRSTVGPVTINSWIVGRGLR